MKTHRLVIEAGKTEGQYWRDLWRYRELFYFLAWRDFLVRYKQTVFGVSWAVIRPILTMAVLTFVFGRVAKLDAGDVPYPILVLAGLLPWQLFSNALSESSNSLIVNSNLVSKIYFPRMIVPASAIIVSFMDFFIAFLILLAFILGYQYVLSWRIFTLPVFIILVFATAMGGGLWLAALNVKYRDFRYLIPFVIQFGLYISPVGFSSEVVPDQWRLLYSLNPMAGVIDGFRWAILGGGFQPYWPGFGLSMLVAAGLLGSGIWYFRRAERTFADII